MCDNICVCGTSSTLNKQSICNHLKNDIEVFCFDSIDSTNSYAKRVHSQCDTPTLFAANHQSSGRGRLGRSFYSPADTGLYMSLLLDVADNNDDIICMTTATSVCVVSALKELYDVAPQIKWVNDIYLNNKKLCGILCEAITDEKNQKIEKIIIGIGINLSTQSFPDDIKHTATSLNKTHSKEQLCAKIADNIIEMSRHLHTRDFIDEYKKHSLVLGCEISYTQNGVTKEATAIDIDRNGGLVIQTQDGTKTLHSGEITVRLKK